MAEHTHRTANDPIDRLLDNSFAMTVLTLSVAAGAIMSVVIGFRILTAFAWAIGG